MDYREKCYQLVKLLKTNGINNKNVLMAISQIPRHLFVASNYLEQAYTDCALPIDNQQTISQPYIVAKMTELLMQGNALNNVLEIGTGSGYQAAVLSKLVKSVYTVERIKHLLVQAQEKFHLLALKNIHCLHGDGLQGWSEYGPYDGIIVTAGAQTVPPALLAQLANNARLVIPIRTIDDNQELQVITRQGNSYITIHSDAVVFVPLLPEKVN
jgi:protein-L-isoaspartate(D-aspartate) O-methyltransferase